MGMLAAQRGAHQSVAMLPSVANEHGFDSRCDEEDRQVSGTRAGLRYEASLTTSRLVAPVARGFTLLKPGQTCDKCM